MPELPELEVVREVLDRRAVGQTIVTAAVTPGGGAIVVRDLTFGTGDTSEHPPFEQTVAGRGISEVIRRGKFLVLVLKPSGGSVLDPPLFLVVNPKLTGRLQLAAPADKRSPKTHLVLSLSGGGELRYVDQKTMGQVYLTRDPTQVPDYFGLGPEPLTITLDEFRARLKNHRGEIKGILTRGEFVAGIGNAYADEILWAAKLNPFKKRTELLPGEMDRLYEAMRSTLLAAIGQVRDEMGEAIHLKPRDFLAVHMKTGQPCPRCGTAISSVGANQRITNFCRQCQPGGLVKGIGEPRTGD